MNITKNDIIEILESKIKWYERIEAIPPLRDKARNVIAVNIASAILDKIKEKEEFSCPKCGRCDDYNNIEKKCNYQYEIPIFKKG